MKDEYLQELAKMIASEISKGFEQKHLTHNLVDTMEILEIEDGYEVHIPAKIYNEYKWFTKGIIIYMGKGSYASSLDKEGSAFMYYYREHGDRGAWKRKLVKPRNHIGYIDGAILSATNKWKEKHGWLTQQEKF